MDLLLIRDLYRNDGIFGEIFGDKGLRVAVTLEHSFPEWSRWADRSFKAVIPSGIYQCVRGKHRLEHMTEDFETFEITGVTGHTGLVFHWGCFNRDSKGCVLLGKALAGDDASGEMITHSRDTFAAFMALQVGIDQFTLAIR